MYSPRFYTFIAAVGIGCLVFLVCTQEAEEEKTIAEKYRGDYLTNHYPHDAEGEPQAGLLVTVDTNSLRGSSGVIYSGLYTGPDFPIPDNGGTFAYVYGTYQGTTRKLGLAAKLSGGAPYAGIFCYGYGAIGELDDLIDSPYFSALQISDIPWVATSETYRCLRSFEDNLD